MPERKFLGPAVVLIGPDGAGRLGCIPFVPAWQTFLSRQPVEPLSFRKTEASLPQRSIMLARQWDIDKHMTRSKGSNILTC